MQTARLKANGRAFAHIAEFHPELTALRRDLHAHPELGFEEVYTARQIKEALVLTRDEVHSIPLHHQLRPWAMKKGVTTIHRADDRPEARFTSVNPGGS